MSCVHWTRSIGTAASKKRKGRLAGRPHQSPITMSTLTSTFAEIKQRIRLRDVARDQGISLPPDGKKFKSPFRTDHSPSCTVKGDMLRDWSTGESFDVVDFYAKAKGLSTSEAVRDLVRLYPGQSLPSTPKPATRFEALKLNLVRKPNNCFGWPVLEAGDRVDILELALLRDINSEALVEMSRRGLLYFADFEAGRAFVVTDSSRHNAQARLLSGEKWLGIDASTRSPRSESGAVHGWPIGIADAANYPAIALCEGVPDFLSALHHASVSEVMDKVAPVMMAGASVPIAVEALPFFSGKRVRIFIHQDNGAGMTAFQRWSEQLREAGAVVDGYEFSDLFQSNGMKVKDLNDLCRIDVDSWEKYFYQVESQLFDFVNQPEKLCRVS